MNAADLATDTLAAQECESLAACVARGQSPESYQDILLKIRGHVEKLPPERKAFWAGWLREINVDLFPPAPKGKSSKPEASSKP